MQILFMGRVASPIYLIVLLRTLVLIKNHYLPFFIRYDLSELLIRLRQYDKAEKVLLQALENEGQGKISESFSRNIILMLRSLNYKKKINLPAFSKRLQ